MTEWYYLEGGQQHGPVSLAELRDRLAGLPPDTPVWHSGLTEWRPAAAVPETAAAPQVPALPLSQAVQRYPPARRPSVLPLAQPSYANWLLRAAAMLVDQILFFGGPLVALGIIAGLGLTDEKGEPAGVGLVIFIPGCGFAFALGIWNRILRDGKTGQTLGRQLTGTRLIDFATGAPIGLGKVLLRQLCHVLDNLPCVCLPLGFLWPLWDQRRQTFADKIVGSIVVRER